MPITQKELIKQKIDRVVSTVISLARAEARYATESEHTSMSGTYEEESELKEALEDLFGVNNG